MEDGVELRLDPDPDELPKALAELLMSGAVGDATDRLGDRGRPRYALGAGWNKVFSPPRDILPKTWYLAPHGVAVSGPRTSDSAAGAQDLSGTGNRRLPFADLAHHLWPDVSKEPAPRGCQPLLAVADPVSNTMTLSWHLTPEAEILDSQKRRAVPPSPGGTVAGLIADRVEIFFRQTRRYEPWLVRRPSLQLVFVGKRRQGLLELEQAVNRLLRQIGPYLADFQVRWVDCCRFGAHDRPGWDLLREILLFHLPWEIWPESGQAFEPEKFRRIVGQIERFQEKLRRFDQVSRESVRNAFEALQEIEDLEAATPGLEDRSAPPVVGPHGVPSLGESVAELPRSVPLGLRLAARQGQLVAAENRLPQDLPLAPLTLVAGDNATGKSNLAEALCLSHTGLPRLRRQPPAGSDRWRDRRFPEAPGDEPPYLAWLRVRESRAGEPSQLGGGFLPARDLLPLFADDADLARGERGDLAVVTWLPFPGLRSADAAGSDLGDQLVEILGLVNGLPEPKFESPASRLEGDFRPPHWIFQAFRQTLRKRQDDLGIMLQELEENLTEPLPQETRRLLDAELNEAHSLLESVELDQQQIERRRSKLPRELLSRHDEALVSYILQLDSWTGSAEDREDLAVLDRALGGGSAFARWAESQVRAKLGELQWAVIDFLGELAGRLWTSPDFEDDLDRYLSQLLDPWDEQGTQAAANRGADRRLNTAATVRLGQTSRLARWLGCGNVDWPLLILDEPTLGQDDASCARALVRHLRLMRRVEAKRWADFLIRSDDHPVEVELEFLEILDLEKWPLDRRLAAPPADRFRRQTPQEEGSAVVRSMPDLPRPPQALVLSYREEALSVVSDLEGAVLDHRTRTDLERLVPKIWWGDLTESLARARADYRGFLDRLPRNMAVKASPFLLRSYWQPPLELTSSRAPGQKCLEEARGALRRLGLVGLAEDFAESVADQGAVEACWRLLAWLLATDLLPAALADGESFFNLGGVSLRRLPPPGGGLAQELGPTRLRRVIPMMDVLPALPSAWKAELERALPTAAVPRPPGEAGGPWRVAVGSAPGAGSPELEEALAELRTSVPLAGFDLLSSGEHAERQIELSEGFDPQKPELRGEPTFWWRLADAAGETLREAEKPMLLETAETTLLRALVRDRARQLAEILAAEEAVNLVLASTNREETPVPAIAFRWFVDPTASPPVAARPAEEPAAIRGRVLGVALERVRSALAASANTRRVRFYLRCTLGTALRAGSVFHRAAGFRVESEHYGALWNLDQEVEPADDALLEVVEEGTVDSELHLLVSVSQDVRSDYQAWARGRTGREARVVHLSPAGGPGRTAIRSASHAAQWARAFFTTIESERPTPDLSLRLFFAAPAALALACGRELNAVRNVIAMDHLKELGGYIEAFRFGNFKTEI